jgi:hypothetical protein
MDNPGKEIGQQTTETVTDRMWRQIDPSLYYTMKRAY